MLIDKFNRKIDYLRVSVTQRCNFRYQYCMPEKPFEWTPKEDLLSYKQMFKFIKVAIDKGIKNLREDSEYYWVFATISGVYKMKNLLNINQLEHPLHTMIN